MPIAWNNNDKPVTLKGNSKVWTDDGAPLPYTISHCPGQRVWRARFEGSLVCRGTLQECMAACEAADRDGVFGANPDPVAMARESADNHSNFGTE